MWTVLLLVFLIPSSAFAQYSSMNCEPLDPRAKIAKETETRINASVKTVLKVAQAGGEVERKAKEEIQNLPSGTTGKDQIEARWIYLFCEMLRTSGNLSEAQKKQYFGAVVRATHSTSEAPASPKPKQSKEPAKATAEKNMTESPCSNPIEFKQERFRPTSPPYPAHFLYGARATFQMVGNKDSVCRFRIIGDNPIEGGDFGPSSSSGAGRVRTIEVSCEPGISKNIQMKIFGTGPIGFNCIDAIR
jgi:hypothetical protein